MDFEIKIIEFLQAGRTPFFDVAFQVISLIGSFVGAVALVILFLFTKRKYAFWFLFTYGFTYLAQSLLKTTIQRERPFNVSDTIMNIGDTVTMIAIFLGAFLFSIYKKKGQRVWVVLALTLYVGLVMLSRMYLGKHFLTDVLAGAGLSIVFGILGLLLMRLWDKRKKKNENSNGNT